MNIYIRFAKRTRAAEADVASVLSADQIAAAETVAGMLAKGSEVVIQLPVTDNFDQLARATLKAVFEAMPANKRTGVSFATGLTSADISRKGGDVSLIITDKSQQQTGEGKRWIDLSQDEEIRDRTATITAQKTSEAQRDNGVRFSADDTDAIRVKDQIRQNQDKLNEMDPVVHIKSEGKQGRTSTQLRDALIEFFASRKYGVDRQGFGRVLFNVDALGTMPRYIKTDAEFAAVKAAPAIVKRGIQIGYEDNHKGRGIKSYTFAAPAILNEERGNVAVVVQVTSKNKAHCARVLMPDGSGFDLDVAEKADQEARRSENRAQQRMESASKNSIAGTNQESNTSTRDSLDTEYLDLAEKYKSGTATKAETEQLRKAVDQAARKAGYTTKAYHGTTADFTKFDKSKIGSATDEGVYGRGFYFSTSRQQSEQYSKGKAPMEVFLNTGNQLLLNDHSSVEELADLLNMSESNLTQDRSTGVVRPLYSQVNQFAAHVQEAGYDSVRADYGASDEIVMFDSDRIKSADPVTYDDKGNIIPLSERFNAKSDDIRYIIDEDAIRQAFTVIDTAGIEDGLEALKERVRVKGQAHGTDAEKPVDIEKDHTQNELRRLRGFRPVERHSTAG